MEKNINKWELFRKYINSNSKLSRQGILKVIGGGSTTDNYINLTRNCGFIHRVSPGKYVKVVNIPDEITSSKVQKLAYVDKAVRLRYIRKLKIKNIIS